MKKSAHNVTPCLLVLNYKDTGDIVNAMHEQNNHYTNYTTMVIGYQSGNGRKQ